MAILKSGNLELEIRFDKYYPEQRWSDYSFEPRIGGRPLFNQQVNKKAFKDGRYINWNVWSDDTLIETFEKLLGEKKDVSWNLWPEDNIRIEAKTWLSRKEQTMKGWEGKTMHVKEEDGNTREVPYSEGMEIFECLFVDYFDLDITLNSCHFIDDQPGFENFGICLKMKLSFATLEVFLNELKGEYEVFKLLMADPSLN